MTRKTTRPRKRVALLLPAGYYSTERELKGVTDYARRHGDWTILMLPETFTGRLEYLRRWDGDGAIAPVSTPGEARLIRQLPFPVVGLSGALEEGLVSRVLVDDATVGRFTAGYLLERGFRRLVFVGGKGCDAKKRLEAFTEQAVQAGATVKSLSLPASASKTSAKTWEARLERLGSFLGKLELPVGVMGYDDSYARLVMDACRAVGLRVPEEVAVIGAGSNPSLCEFSDPALSSLELPEYEIGRQAAILLERLMVRRRKRRDVLLAPGKIVERASTEVQAIENEQVRKAVVYMREHVGRIFGIAQLMAEIELPRRRFELMFRRAMGCTPYQYLRRVRVDRAKELLLGRPGMNLQEIAAACGFGSLERFRIVFEQLTKVRPKVYRLRHGRVKRKSPPEGGSIETSDKPKRVAVLLEAPGWHGVGSQMKAIQDYARMSGGWEIVTIYHTHVLDRRGVKADFDGIIFSLRDRKEVECIARLSIPAVTLFNRYGQSKVSWVMPDYVEDGRLAAEHLLDRGFRRMAFVGIRGRLYTLWRCQGFSARAVAAGATVENFLLPAFSAPWKVWSASIGRLEQFLRDLTPPVGVMGCDDVRAHIVVETCRAVGLRVPEEVAVIGVDNNLPVCQFCDPSLTSVDSTDYERGYEAAALLDRMMRGEEVAKRDIAVPSRGVVGRSSTHTLAIENPHARAAVDYIHEHLHEAFGVERLLKATGVSRTWLENALRDALGHTPHEYLCRARVAKARELLGRDSDKKIADIAAECGFTSAKRFHITFHRIVGMNPRDYRRRLGAGAAEYTRQR